MRTILILAVNPKGTGRLRVDEEVKKIEQGLERATERVQFKVVVKWAVTSVDLRRALLDHKPEIVHFAGHGTADGQGGTGRERNLLGCINGTRVSEGSSSAPPSDRSVVVYGRKPVTCRNQRPQWKQETSEKRRHSETVARLPFWVIDRPWL